MYPKWIMIMIILTFGLTSMISVRWDQHTCASFVSNCFLWFRFMKTTMCSFAKLQWSTAWPSY